MLALTTLNTKPHNQLINSANKSLNQEEGKIRETAQSLSGAIRDPGHVQNTI